MRNETGGRLGPALSAGIFLAIAAMVWFATRQGGGPVDLFERGHWLGPASDMLAGRIPYRETYPIHGFFSDGGLDALLFKALGPDFSVSVNAHHLLGSLFQPALFLVTLAATGSLAVACLAIPLHWSFATALVADRPVLALLGLAAFLQAIRERPRRRTAALAGGLAGLGLLYALDFGSFALIAELLTLLICWRLRRRTGVETVRGAAFLAGLAAVAVPFAAYLAAHGALVPAIRQAFELPLQIHRIWGWSFPSPPALLGAWMEGRAYVLDGLPIGPGIAKRLYLAPVLGLAGLLVSYRSLKRQEESGPPFPAIRLAALSLACLLFFRYALARLHLEVGNALTGPTLATALALLWHEPSAAHARRWRVVLASIGLLGAVAMNAPARTLGILGSDLEFRRRLARFDGVPLTIPRGGGIRVPSAEAQELAALVRFFDDAAPPGSPILDLTNRPGLYFFLRHPNATRFYQVPPMELHETEILAALEARPPWAVFLDGGGELEVMDHRSNRLRIPRVFELVERVYPVRVRVGRNLIALRTEPSTSGS